MTERVLLKIRRLPTVRFLYYHGQIEPVSDGFGLWVNAEKTPAHK